MRAYGVVQAALALSGARLVDAQGGIGDAVASGLGLAASSSTTSLDSSGAASTTSLTTTPSSPASIATTSTSISSGLPYGNVSVDECWASWIEFWSWREDKTEWHSDPVSTIATTYIETYGQNATTYGTYTSVIDETRTIDNGGFAISTQTIQTTSRTTAIQKARSTFTSTSELTYTSWSQYHEKPTNSVTRPSCKLPQHVPQCQGEWEGYISTVLNHPRPTPPPGCDVGAGFLNGRTVPPCASSYNTEQESYYSWSTSAAVPPECRQASVGGELCQSVRDDYVRGADWFAPAEYTTAFFFSAGYLGTFQNVTAGSMQPSYHWPTSATLNPAPSCTLGCGRCAVTGGTVDVLYWPSHTATDEPEPTTPVTLETLGTTLTSPTVYISYSNLYASNGCSGLGPTITSTIVPIPTDQTLSSVYAGTIGCDAHFRMTQVWTATASFNFADLQESVPYSIYSSQPWCQTYLRNQGCQGTCPTDTPYKPIVVVPQDVLQALRPEWADCFGDIRGAYDPPKALQQVGSAVGPSQPDPTGDGYPEPASPTSATPANGPDPTTPAPTGGPSADPTGDPDPQAVQNPGLTEGGDGGQEQPTQNPGGIIASLLGPSGGDGNEPTPTTQNAGGVIASLLGGNTGAAQDGQSDSSSDPGLGNTDSAEGSESESAGTEGEQLDQASEGSHRSPAAGVATLGSETITAVSMAESPGTDDPLAVEVFFGGSTITISPGQTATINGDQVRVDDDGAIVYGTGGTEATLVPATQASDDASPTSGAGGAPDNTDGTSTEGSGDPSASESSTGSPSGVEQQINGVGRPSVSWWTQLLSGLAVIVLSRWM